jgi:hypothetical protein
VSHRRRTAATIVDVAAVEPKRPIAAHDGDEQPRQPTSLPRMLGKVMSASILIKLGHADAEFVHSASAVLAVIVLDGHRNTMPLSGFELAEVRHERK